VDLAARVQSGKSFPAPWKGGKAPFPIPHFSHLDKILPCTLEIPAPTFLNFCSFLDNERA